jgi:hypothetical protein
MQKHKPAACSKGNNLTILRVQRTQGASCLSCPLFCRSTAHGQYTAARPDHPQSPPEFPSAPLPEEAPPGLPDETPPLAPDWIDPGEPEEFPTSD